MVAFSFFDIIFPKHCLGCGRFGSYICSSCFSKIEFVNFLVCPVCRLKSDLGRTHSACKSKWSLDGLLVVCRYGGVVKRAIIKVKYKNVFDIEKFLVDLLFKKFSKSDFGKDVLMVPIPLHKKRKKWRGFNQSEILAKQLSKKFEVNFEDILERVIETKPQVGLNKVQRRENVSGAFSLKKGVRVIGRNIILVDDVFTSGVTCSECCRVLKEAGAKSVWAMVVAWG